MHRYSLRTLLFLLAIGPPLLAGVAVGIWHASTNPWAFLLVMVIIASLPVIAALLVVVGCVVTVLVRRPYLLRQDRLELLMGHKSRLFSDNWPRPD
jgi:hypothetical protein